MNNIHILSLAAVSVLSVAATFYLYFNLHKKRYKSSIILILLLLIVAITSIAQLFERGFSNIHLALISHTIEGLGLYYFSVTWVIFTSIYTGQNFHKTKVFSFLTILFSFFVTISLFLQFPYEAVFAQPYVSDAGLIQGQKTFVYYIIVSGTYVLIFTGLVSFLKFSYTSKRNSSLFIFLFFSAISVLGSIIHIFTPSVFPFRVVTLVFFLFGVLLSVEFELLMVERIAQASVYRHISDPIIVFNSDKEVVDYNNAAEERDEFNLNFEKKIGESVNDFLPEDLQEKFSEVDKKGEVIFEYVFGEEAYTYQIKITKVVRKGHHIGYTMFSQDITDIKETQKEMERRKKELEQFAEFISHDLRNPLNAIQGGSEVIKKEISEKENDRIHTAADIVSTSTKRMNDMISDMELMFRESKKETEMSPVEIKDAANSAWEITKSGRETEGATLRFETNETIYADKSKLQTIFENLFKNAIENVGSDVTISIDYNSEQKKMRIYDDGPGIPDRVIDDVFDFGVTTGQDGTGLGLAIVYEMASAHGWEIYVDEEFEGGACFVIENVNKESKINKSVEEGIS